MTGYMLVIFLVVQGQSYQWPVQHFETIDECAKVMMAINDRLPSPFPPPPEPFYAGCQGAGNIRPRYEESRR